ncbi:lipid A deacylase LpxR family protein [Polaribacter sp. PL03]|uniref:lipid A deacylase LpxR family protein n=1 Tax=Polaribacter sp. PL03 TaxID=3088353 RepID=UPI0029CEC7FE|nr:lipid A deacylase LpxR family protein [Polaribacter sp. PL03]MDX6747010.1 lipid A deacylase LpxR family protein [Polaribacter sp. PL03]
MKKNILILFIFFTISLFSQEKFSREISFITDNDLYTSTYDDRYYTNGMFFSYKYLSKEKNENLEKRILEWEIGHEMYTPNKAVTLNINNHDRPFAGYLYGSYSINRVYKNKQSFKTTLQLGVIGSNAFSKELQDFIHNLYGFTKAVGWKHQIKNALALNFNAEYNTFLGKDKTNHFDISWINNAKIGTVYTNISSGFLARIGFKPLQSMMNSIAFKTNINNKNTSYFREIESFLFIKPTLRYAFYDATLQGSFLSANSEITNELVPLVFNVEIGLKFSVNRFNFGYTFNYNTNKSKDLKFDNGHKYGSINFNYLLK